MAKKIINKKMKFPKTHKSQAGKYGTEIVESEIATEKNKAPLDIIEVQNAELKDNSYVPQSESCTTVDTVVPNSMRYDMHKAIETIDRRVNGVDEYVAEKLGYFIGNCSMDQRKEGLRCLCDAFSAEQVDAIAVAIYNIEEKRQGCIIGDQTGIGKGRIAAGMIRYAIHRGLKPIFLTEKPNLFSDLFRDIINIGSDDAIPLEVFEGYNEVERKATKQEVSEDGESEEEDETEDTVLIKIPVYRQNKNYEADIRGKKRCVPYIVNGRGVGGNTAIKDEKGNILYKGLAANENKNVIESYTIPADYDFVLSTYSQFRGASDSVKMKYLAEIAKGNVVIMDESHNASGASNVGAYLMKVLAETLGVTFLSATFAKRPDNMAIYASKTALSEANLNPEALTEAIISGGVALQEIVSTNLTAEGQMIRRERSFEGIEVNYEYLDKTQAQRGYGDLDLEQKHRAIMDRATDVIRDIMAFQDSYVNPVISNMDKDLKAEYKQAGQRKGTSKAGVDNTPTFSGIFNVINQLLFSIKAEAVADVAIQRLKQGKKPVIAFASTMESFLNTMTNDEGLPVKAGDIVNSDFSKILEKRLKSILKYTIKNAEGDSEVAYIDVEEQDADFQFEYKRILSKIKESSIGISSSPIDVLTNRIEQAGYSVVEVTGRDRQLKIMGGDVAKVKARVKVGANDAFRQFNNNEVDCLLINQSGSTGASAHALPNSKVPPDKVRQRVMIILQAELNINTEVQKRGRINRTGQILKPIYDYVISAIPSEKRLMMMLQKKLKSLDANTTSSQKQNEELMDSKNVDFLNKFGDQIVVEYLKENELINKQIGDPLKLEENPDQIPADAAHRVSGRVAILSVKDQENFYSELSERYASLVEYLRQSGEYDIEVENMNLEAETLEKDVVVVGKGGDSVFGRHSILEKVRVNNLRKPYSKKDVENLLKESLGKYSPESLQKSTVENYTKFTANALELALKDADEYYDNLIKDVHKDKKIVALPLAEKANAVRDRIENLEQAKIDYKDKLEISSSNKQRGVMSLLKNFSVGKVIAYPSVTYSFDKSFYKGIFLGFVINENTKNPYAPSALKLRFAVASSQRYIAVPASKVDIVDAVTALTYTEIYGDDSDTEEFMNSWDDVIAEKTTDKTTRHIISGNILQAFGKRELRGALISYTTINGGIKQGILLPESFGTNIGGEKAKALRITVPIITALPIIQSMIVSRGITTNDQFTIIKVNDDNFRLLVPISKKTGGKFFLDKIIIGMTKEKNFNKSADKMVATLEAFKIKNLVTYLQNTFNSSVDLIQQEFDRIKGSLVIEEYADEVKKPNVNVFIEKLTEVDTEGKTAEEQKAIAAEQEKAESGKKESESVAIEKRKLAATKKLMALYKILLESGSVKTFKTGGTTGESSLEEDKEKAYQIGVTACKNNKPRVPAQSKELMDLIFSKDANNPNSSILMKAFYNGYYDENQVDVKKLLFSK